MATVNIEYHTDVALACNCTGLATSSFTSGYESAVVDNTSTKYLDCLLSGKVTVGTTPTANTQIQVHVYAPIEDTPTYPDVLDGTESAETLTNLGVGQGFLKLAAIMPVPVNTSDVSYPFGPVSVANLFGGVMPPLWGIFVTHNTGVNLNGTGANQAFYYKGITLTVA